MTTQTLSNSQLLKSARAFHTKKKLGQHFLVDAQALNEIVDSLELSENDSVLEIGPGIGFLTRVLASRAGQLTAVELDRDCVEQLKTLKLENLSIKHGDFLAYDILSGRFRQDGSMGWSEEEKERKVKVVGNVPYQITGLILAHLLGEIAEPSAALKHIDRIVLTVQREVALRMVAPPGTRHYARLSLLVSYFADAGIVCQLPAESFYPVPQVDSAVVKLTPLAAPPVDCNDHKFLRRVIRAGFAQRRKMLRNALTSLSISQDRLNQVFKDLQMDPQVRAESLSLQKFALLADALS